MKFFFYSLRWLIYVFNPVVNTKLPAILSHRRSTTVSLETYPFIQWNMLLIYILIISVQIPILVVVCVIRIEVWIIQKWFWFAKYSPKMSHVYEIHGEPFAWWSCKKLRQSSKNDIYSKRTKFVQKMSRKNF